MKKVFQRYEKKFLLSTSQQDALLMRIANDIESDVYAKYLVQSLYLDTPSWEVVRNSIEKPLYKEKMRLRCYEREITKETMVFLELKKKYDGRIYKRRIAFPASELLASKSLEALVLKKDSPIAKELGFYLKTHPVANKMYISAERKTFVGKRESNLRLTFDEEIKFRTTDLHFTKPHVGAAVLASNEVLLEIKTPFGMPLWLARVLSELKIFPISFSKYGHCYRVLHKELNENELKGEL